MSNRSMRSADLWRLVVPIMATFLLLAGCVPADQAGGSRVGATPAPLSVPKTLVMVVQDEPTALSLYGGTGEGGSVSSRYERYFIFHGNLTQYDDAGNVRPHVAQKIPTVEDGDWKVNPDGTMEVTWKIRPDVYWHDGTPLTSEDYVFGFEVLRDPTLAVSAQGDVANMAGAKALDPKTLVVNWKNTSIFGNVNSLRGVPAIARQQVEALYRQGSPEAFQASQAWRGEYVGIGPYRLTKFEVGSHLEAEAFDKYFLGRPKIDRLVIRWVTDINVAVANVLAGTVDVVGRGSSVKPEQMVEIQRQWGTTGGVVFPVFNDIRAMSLNFRVEGNPWEPSQAGWQQDVRFRQAMLHSINRQDLADVLHYGFTEVAQYPTLRSFPVYRLAEQRGLPTYPYEPARAQQLFTAAGWTKGTDGLLRNGAGQTVPFACCRQADNDTNAERESLSWGSYLKVAGLDVSHPTPSAPAGVSAEEGRRITQFGWGGKIFSYQLTADTNFAHLSSQEIPSAANRWNGLNGLAWTQPTFQNLFTKAMSTLNPAQRLETEFQLLQIMMQELPLLPIYPNPSGVVVRTGVTGVGKGDPLNRAITTDIHLWDVQR